MNNLPVAQNQTDDAFFKTLAAFQGGSSPKPTYVRLDGKDGKWYEQRYSEADKRNVKTPWHGGEAWEGSLLLVKFFAKAKYQEGAKTTKRTREFSDFNQPVKLLEIDFTQKDGTKELATYPTYAAFKEALDKEFAAATQLAVMHKKPIPSQDDFKYDLWTSLYVYDFETEKVVNIKAKGVSRKAVFDYLSSWRNGLEDETIQSYSQTRTRFEAVEYKEPKKSLTYYAMRLVQHGILQPGERAKVREALMQLLQWMKSFEKDKDAEDDAETVHVEPVTEDTPLSDIPF